MNDIELATISANQAEPHIKELVETFLDVYSSFSDESFSEERYRRQLGKHIKAAGWMAICAYTDNVLAGYIYGFRLSQETDWWSGLVDETSANFTRETGSRTFAISELLVREKYRRRGIATLLHNELLASRSEDRMTLLVRPENAPALAAYRAWGWSKVNRLHPDCDIPAPTYDVMTLSLTHT